MYSRVDGRVIWTTIGRWPIVLVKHARDWISDHVPDVIRGVNLNEQKRAQAAQRKIDEAATLGTFVNEHYTPHICRSRGLVRANANWFSPEIVNT